MKKTSVWKVNAEKASFPTLKEDITVDVAIIGAGITGITAGYLLSKAGKKVAILEAGKVGQGATGFSTGNLYAMIGSEGLHSVKSKWDKDVMKDVIASRAEAVDFIEDRVKEFKIDCDFKRVPWCLFTNNDNHESYITKEREAVEAAGLSVVSKIPFPLPWKFGFRVNKQAQFNPYAYTIRFAESIQSDDCRIYENSKVIKVDEGEVCTIETPNGTVTADQVVMATHTPKGHL